jgi:hypothetical protein
MRKLMPLTDEPAPRTMLDGILEVQQQMKRAPSIMVRSLVQPVLCGLLLEVEVESGTTA